MVEAGEHENEPKNLNSKPQQPTPIQTTRTHIQATKSLANQHLHQGRKHDISSKLAPREYQLYCFSIVVGFPIHKAIAIERREMQLK